MEARTARPSAPVIVGLIGGVLLVIGSFLTWASVSVNVGALAELLGVDEAVLQGAIPGETSRTLSGMSSPADGIWTLIAGLVVLGSAVVVMIRPDMRLAAGAMIVAGLVGIGWTVYDLTQINDVRDEALGSFAAALQGAGVDVGTGEGLVDVSAGIGLWGALVGGIVALIAGAMVLMSARPAAGASSAGATTPGFVGGPDDMGFGGGTAPAPVATPTPPAVADAPVAPAPVAPAPVAPPPPPADLAATDAPTTDPPATDPPKTDPPPTQGGTTDQG